jgi:hypothetical protein
MIVRPSNGGMFPVVPLTASTEKCEAQLFPQSGCRNALPGTRALICVRESRRAIHCIGRCTLAMERAA